VTSHPLVRARERFAALSAAAVSRGHLAAAVHGGKASKGRIAPRGRPEVSAHARKGRWLARPNRNGVSPRVGSEVQHLRSAREEEAGEVVENHEVGT
jgi:hypothetical protein